MMNDWRNDAATKSQRYLLGCLGVSYADNIRKGQAHDLIGQHKKPNNDQLHLLKFFRVKDVASFSQYDATVKIEELLSDPANNIQWEERLCTAEQREILNFFDLPVRPQLKYRDADTLIMILLKNDTYAKRWDSYEHAKFKREEWLERNREYVNDVAAFLGCKKLTVNVFTEVVGSLEDRGMTLEEIENDYENLFQETLILYPQLEHARHEVKYVQANDVP